ncbi:hypothetical protein [Photobacterium damselae]|uniref:hypothetical protein n=1 Tax=Photobacterium damselae TaxID=38293 RepID=UPI0040689717
MTTINANNRKCRRENIYTVSDVFQRLLELSSKNIEYVRLESAGTVMMFVENHMIFNSKLDCDSENRIKLSTLIDTFKALEADEPVKSFNHGWALCGILANNNRYIAIDSRKAEHFQMPKISFERHQEHLRYHVNYLGSCPFDLFCETVGINNTTELAPVFDLDKASVRNWRNNGIPLAIAVRTSVITQMNIDYMLGGSSSPFCHEQY